MGIDFFKEEEIVSDVLFGICDDDDEAAKDENLQPMTIGITTNHLKKSIEEINLQHKTK